VAFKIFRINSNYLAAGAATSVAGASVVAAGASVVAGASAATVVSTTVSAGTSVAGASTAAASSVFLQDTNDNTATTAKLKNTFFILLFIKG
jgi:hypothetical protein